MLNRGAFSVEQRGVLSGGVFGVDLRDFGAYKEWSLRV